MGELEIIQTLPLEGFEIVVVMMLWLRHDLKRLEVALDRHRKRNAKDHRRAFKMIDTLSRRLAKVER